MMGDEVAPAGGGDAHAAGEARGDAVQLHGAALALFRAGTLPEAEALMARALRRFQADDATGAGALGALSDLGALRAARGDAAGALAAHRSCFAARRSSLGETHPETALSQHNAGQSLHALGRLTEAEEELGAAERAWETRYGPVSPLAAKSAMARARVARDAFLVARHDRVGHAGAGDGTGCAGYAAAVAHAERALAIETCLSADGPKRGGAFELLGDVHAAWGDFAKALRDYARAIDIFRQAGAVPARLFHAAGMSAQAAGAQAKARGFFAAAIEADPDHAASHHRLAAMLDKIGLDKVGLDKVGLDKVGEREAASATRDGALRRFPVLTQTGLPGRPRVLIPSLASDGNIPLEHLLPAGAYTRLFWYLDHDPDPARRDLPAFDVVLNAMADPDCIGAAGDGLARFFAARPDVRVLNRPARIAATRRDRLAETLCGLADVVVPLTLRVGAAAGAAEWHAAVSCVGAPVLLRPAASHGGDGLRLFETASALPAAAPGGDCYLTRFYDTRGLDGYFRKYRVAFIGAAPFPYHLAISPHWMVHYASAGMADDPVRLTEERAFLASPEHVLGERAWRALAAIGRRLDLDFCGIDFTLTDNREILVFEANATMLIHPEAEDGKLAHKNAAIARILRGFDARIRACMAEKAG